MKTIKSFIAILLCTSLCAHLTLLAQPPPAKRQKCQPGRCVQWVVHGTIEPDYKFPWVVEVTGAMGGRGVLIAPRWVLTAAHIIYPNPGATVYYKRTDPVTGETRIGMQRMGFASIFIHPDYVPGKPDADIALLRLPEPFPPDPFLQPAGLPIAASAVGEKGTVASSSHTIVPLPDGYVGVLRGAITHVNGKNFRAISPDASLCPGDSGSGWVTRIWTKGPISLPWDREPVRGLNVVTGIAVEVLISNCMTVSKDFYSVEVYEYLDWIRSTTSNPNELIVRFYTGDDDLRGGNDNVDLKVLLRAGAPLQFKNVNGGKPFGGNSTNTIRLPLPPTLMFEDIVGVVLQTTSRGGIGVDNWNLNRLMVSARIGGYSLVGEERQLFDQSENPLFRFTGINYFRGFSFLPKLNELIVRFYTGDDDLRGSNDNVNLEVLLRAGAPLWFRNVNGGKRYGNNSTNTISLTLPPTLKFEDIVGVRLQTTFGGGISGDKWNLNRLMLSARIGDQYRQLFDQKGNPLFSFTGFRPVREVRF